MSPAHPQTHPDLRSCADHRALSRGSDHPVPPCWRRAWCRLWLGRHRSSPRGRGGCRQVLRERRGERLWKRGGSSRGLLLRVLRVWKVVWWGVFRGVVVEGLLGLGGGRRRRGGRRAWRRGIRRLSRSVGRVHRIWEWGWMSRQGVRKVW